MKELKLRKSKKKLASVWVFLRRAIQAADEDITFGLGCPALLQVPHRTLAGGRLGNHVQMVQNGTACLVLKVRRYAGLVSLMELMEDAQKDLADLHWKKEVLTFPLYFKSKNYLLCDNPKEQDYIDFVNVGKLDDLDQAFKVKSVRTGSGIYILIADLGTTVLEPTCQARNLKFSQLAKKYLFFMKRIIKFQKLSKLYHGDIHVGNVTYWRDRFMLIDYDEARIGVVGSRMPVDDKQRRLYPAALVDEPELYTKHQLMMTLQDILGWCKEEYKKNEHRGVWDFFKSYPGPGKEKPEIVVTKYDTLVGLLEKCGRNGKCNYRPMRESFITASPLTTLSSTADSSVRDVNAIGEEDRKMPAVAGFPETSRDRHKRQRTDKSASPPVTAAQGTPVPRATVPRKSPLTTLSSTADSSVRDVNAIGEEDRKMPAVAGFPETSRDRHKRQRTDKSASPPVTAAQGTPVPRATVPRKSTDSSKSKRKHRKNKN